MNKYKIYISLILILSFLCNYFHSYAYEADNSFTTIMIGRYDNDKKGFLISQYRVIEKQGDFWFSMQDIVELTGYNVSKNDNKIVFTRGSKVIQINIKDETLNVGKNISLIKSPNIIITDHNNLYFSGSQLLPWLNVNCYEDEGILYIFSDVISLWDFVDTFNQTKESYLFDFKFCCQQLGVKSKWLQVASYICDNGISGTLKDILIIPFSSHTYGEYEKYYEILDEMLKEPDTIYNVIEDIVDKGEMAYDMASLIGIIKESDFDYFYAIENGINILSFLHVLGQNNEEKLMWVDTIIGNRLNYSYPEAMISAAFDIKDSYSGIFEGIAIKTRNMYIDWATGKIVDSFIETKNFEKILDTFDIYRKYKLDWVADVDSIKYYNAIASVGRYVFSEYDDTKQTDIYAIELLRAHTALYLYATEKNWEIMANYAEHKGKAQLKNEYLEKASLASEWLTKFIMSSDSTTNDSFRYGKGRMKEEYTDELKSLFSMIHTDVEHQYDDMLNNLKTPKLNAFLSIFIERWFDDYSVEHPDYLNLLGFAREYFKHYDSEKIQYVLDYEVISQKEINKLLKLYFDVLLPDDNLDSIINYDGDYYNNGYFYFTVADGGLWGEIFAIVDEIKETKKGEYVITFYEVYANPGDYDIGDINAMISGENLYYDYNIDRIKKDKFCEIWSKKECTLKWKDNRFILLKYSTIYDYKHMDEIDVASYVYNEIPELRAYDDWVKKVSDSLISMTIYTANDDLKVVDSNGTLHSYYLVYFGESHPDHTANWYWFYVDKRTFQIFWYDIIYDEIHTLEEWRESEWYKKIEELE